MLKKKKSYFEGAKTGPVGGDLNTINSTADQSSVPSAKSSAGKLTAMANLKGAKKGVTQAQKETKKEALVPGELTETEIGMMKESDSPAREAYLAKLKKRLK